MSRTLFPGACLALTFIAVGCGARTPLDDGGSDRGGGSAGDATSAVTAASSTGAATETSSGSGGEELAVTIGSASFGIGCFPPTFEGEDNLGGSFVVSLVNSGSVPRTFVPLDATLHLHDDDPPHQLDWTFLVSPTSPATVPPHDALDVTYDKIPDSGTGDPPPGSLCMFCGSTEEAQLEIRWGENQTVFSDVGVGCTD